MFFLPRTAGKTNEIKAQVVAKKVELLQNARLALRGVRVDVYNVPQPA